jgi:hypothetical protein
MDEVHARVAALRDAAVLARRDLDELACSLQAALTSLDAGARPLEVYGVAALVHGWYTHLERLLERVARELDGSAPVGGNWHRDLLRSMTLDRPGRRPPVIDAALAERLDPVLRFRHLFRNLYVLHLDREGVADATRRVLLAHPSVVSAIDALVAFLESVLQGMDRSSPG